MKTSITPDPPDDPKKNSKLEEALDRLFGHRFTCRICHANPVPFFWAICRLCSLTRMRGQQDEK